jgi:hypothetical protein
MAAVEAILAGIGLVVLIALAVSALSDETPPPPPREDPAAPYREGLRAAVRMQSVAQDLEQQIYAEAARHLDGDAEQVGSEERGRG